MKCTNKFLNLIFAFIYPKFYFPYIIHEHLTIKDILFTNFWKAIFRV
jgi:hypothetical protein